MEKRIGSALILIDTNANIDLLNKIISKHSSIILSRQGLPLKERHSSLISLILEGTTDEIGSLTGQIGRINNIQIKSVLLKQDNKE